MSMTARLTIARPITLVTATAILSLSCGWQSVSGDRNRDSGNGTASNSPVAQKTLKKTWEDIYFEAIDRRTKAAKLNRLREAEAPQNSLEIRVWAGIDLSSLRCVVFRRTGDQWSAFYLPSTVDPSKQSKQVVSLSEPMSGWESLWEKLNQEDILTLPDAHEVGADNVYPDALGVVVEIRSDGAYRAYNYNGFDTSEHVEAKKLNNICKTISKEFGVVLC